MANPLLREATIEDVVHVALNIRQADKDEIWASDRQLPIPCLISAYNRSSKCCAVVINDEVVCIMGVAPISLVSNIGSPWLIGTDAIYKNTFAFLRKCQIGILDITGTYSTLINYVDSRNKVSIRWLSWLGFTVSKEAQPHGPFNMMFHKFEMRN